jgi:hypothetical protein
MASLPKAEWLEKIDFAVWDDRLEMARYQAKSDIKPRELADDDITALVAFWCAGEGTIRLACGQIASLLLIGSRQF